MFRYTYAGVRVIMMQIKERGDTHKSSTLRVPNETTTLFLLRVIIKAVFIQQGDASIKSTVTKVSIQFAVSLFDRKQKTCTRHQLM